VGHQSEQSWLPGLADQLTVRTKLRCGRFDRPWNKDAFDVAGRERPDLDQVYEAYHQVRSNEGGVDLYLIETITDTFELQACIKAIITN
jgi:hypothetical protein